MKIFLSYASQDREASQAIYFALRDQGHKVFFDRTDLPAGEEFHNRIRAAIEQSQIFLFLISANAIDAGSYTLTELDIAEKAKVKMLPVALGILDVGQLPPVLKAMTFLESDGNLPAAVAAEVHRIARGIRRKRLKYIVAALALAVVSLGAVLYAKRGQSKTEIVGKDGAPAILIPGGTFVMGDDEESPRREIFVGSFYLDKYEITVARYAGYLQATGNVGKPAEWPGDHVERVSEMPVVGVDWQDARAYCQWAGRRLPTEAEWEKAARGNDQRKFPWGNDAPTDERARFLKRYQNSVYKDGVAPVGSHPKGVSPFGIHDLSGNVWEWVADWFSESFAANDVRNPKGPD
ncbi:MAG TPA: SUMF1/EgtB/PvdO family nonheme iron enzyme, partial [Candidatus Binatus sp.]|nr:SUMF1/EgtB/PvdO family nonheme iron enzyme [Candidatus Binatus sp.]